MGKARPRKRSLFLASQGECVWKRHPIHSLESGDTDQHRLDAGFTSGLSETQDHLIADMY